jgi:uncharacterized RmlC-like cupin family protein
VPPVLRPKGEGLLDQEDAMTRREGDDVRRALQGAPADRQEAETPATGPERPADDPLRALHAAEGDRQEGKTPATGVQPDDFRGRPGELLRTLREATAGQAPGRGPEYTALRRVRPEALSDATAQTPGLTRAEAISGRTVGAQHLWLGKAVAPAGKVSAVHHHGESETALYVLRGRVTLFFGEGLRQRLDVQAGDYLFVPAWAIHAEGNLGDEDAEGLVARSTPEPLAVDLPELRVPEDLLRAGASPDDPRPM